MLLQIFVGILIAGLNVAQHVGFIVAAIVVMRAHRERIDGKLHYRHILLVLTSVTLWLLLGLIIAMIVWAVCLQALGLFQTLEDATYFAFVSFTTLGFGDVLLPKEWQLLSGMCAAVGLLLFGLSTAFLFEVFARVLEASRRFSDRNRRNG